MKINLLLLIFIAPFFFAKCNTLSVNLEKGVERDIVLVNMEEGDRAFIANLLLKIDSLEPAVIAVNAMFDKEKDSIQDSLLINAFKTIKNDIIIYWVNNEGKTTYANKKFIDHVAQMGVAKFEYVSNLVAKFTPIIKKDDQTYESFPLTIVKVWKPGFIHDFKPNESITINYTRDTGQFLRLNSSEMNEVDSIAIKNKVVLVGYLGPTDEDKFITPLRFIKDLPKDKPDTYGLVIIANAIRTILKHGE